MAYMVGGGKMRVYFVNHFLDRSQSLVERASWNMMRMEPSGGNFLGVTSLFVVQRSARREKVGRPVEGKK
jgi:hypothetical protein